MLLAVLACLCLCLAFTACGEKSASSGGNGTESGSGTESGNESDDSGAEVHTHSAKNFQVDKSEHWKICTECGEKFAVGKHSYDFSNACKTCGYSIVYTEGLEYTLDKDTDTYSVEVGEAKNESVIIIPAYHEGKAVTKIGDKYYHSRRCNLD